jgi:chromosome partitioning protein
MSKNVYFIAVINEKGGVGKTTTVLHLAQAFADLGKKTVVIDGDRLNAAHDWNLMLDAEKDFVVMSAEESMSFSGEREIVLFDTAGGIEKTDIKKFMRFVDLFIVPTLAGRFEFKPMLNLVKQFKSEDKPYSLLINKSYGNDVRANKLTEFLEKNEIPFFSTFIPRSSLVEDAVAAGTTVSRISGGRTIGDKYKKVAGEILVLLQGGE